MAVELRHAREDEMEAVVDLLELVFRGGRKWFHNIITKTRERLAEHPSVLQDGHVVANVVSTAALSIRVSRLTMGGIGHVATHPDFRGQVLSIALPNEAIGLMRQRLPPVPALYGINEFYARLGWTTIPFASTLGPLPKEAPQPSGLYAIENTTVPEGLPEAPGIYEQWAAGWVGALDRSPEYWRVNGSWTDDEFITEDHGATTRAMRDGRVCGYLRGRIANLPPSDAPLTRCAISPDTRPAYPISSTPSSRRLARRARSASRSIAARVILRRPWLRVPLNSPPRLTPAPCSGSSTPPDCSTRLGRSWPSASDGSPEASRRR